MKDLKNKIQFILSDMFLNIDPQGFFPASKACMDIEALVREAIIETVHFVKEDICEDLDNNIDPRLDNSPELLFRCLEQVVFLEKPKKEKTNEQS